MIFYIENIKTIPIKLIFYGTFCNDILDSFCTETDRTGALWSPRNTSHLFQDLSWPQLCPHRAVGPQARPPRSGLSFLTWGQPVSLL